MFLGRLGPGWGRQSTTIATCSPGSTLKKDGVGVWVSFRFRVSVGVTVGVTVRVRVSVGVSVSVGVRIWVREASDT